MRRAANARGLPWYGWLGLVTLLAGQLGVLLDVVALRTIFYCIAWWSYIFIADASVWKRCGNSLVRNRTREFWFLAFWSVAVWNLFEAANFRLQNWFYVNVPLDWPFAFLLNFTAYATVLPAIFQTYEILTAGRFARSARIRPWRVTPSLLIGPAALGVAMLVASLVWPRAAFPLIWGCVVLIGDPVCYGVATTRRRSLLKHLERGDPRPCLRLLLAGLICGGLWEFWNFWAYTKWLYTVPYFEDSKWFEMPPLGFLGFPPFALECYVLVNLLNAARRGRTWEARDGSGAGAPRWLATTAMGIALVFNGFVYTGIDVLTVKSVAPKLEDMEGISTDILDALSRAGVNTPPELLRRTETAEDAGALARASGIAEADLARVREAASLVDLKGLGAANYNALRRLGVWTIAALAQQDADSLFPHWHAAVPRMRPSLPQVRLWVRAAQHAP